MCGLVKILKLTIFVHRLVGRKYYQIIIQDTPVILSTQLGIQIKLDAEYMIMVY